MRAALSNPWRTRLLSWGPALSRRGGPSGARVCIRGLLDIPGDFLRNPATRPGGRYLLIIMLILLPRDAATIPRRGVTNAFCRFESVICEKIPLHSRR